MDQSEFMDFSVGIIKIDSKCSDGLELCWTHPNSVLYKKKKIEHKRE